MTGDAIEFKTQQLMEQVEQLKTELVKQTRLAEERLSRFKIPPGRL
jgi:hypothetical protein